MAWSREENEFLWECCCRSKEICKGNRSGWTNMMKSIWDGKDMSVRTQGSLVLQIKRIEEGRYLSDERRDSY